METSEFFSRVILSILLGFVIGLERQMTGHPAGIRTNMLISLGSCLFMMLPFSMGSDEVFRIASYIVSGVGFLCSGVIFKEGGTARGLNTAATLWCSAAVGVLTSSGQFLIATGAAALLVFVNLISRPLATRIRPLASHDESEIIYRVSVTCAESAEITIRSFLINAGATCKTLFLSNLESGDIIGEKVEIQAEFLSAGRPKNAVLEEIVTGALSFPAVTGAGWETLR